jgi:thioredoxin reductase (NADPH)
VDEYDVIVIGGGVAGLTAGLFAARFGHATLVVLAGAPGGHLLNIEHIETLPGFPDGAAGYDLCPTLQEQADAAGAAFAMAEVQALARDGDGWLVTADAGGWRATAVIVATGCEPRALAAPGADRLAGRGVSHCASCDGPLYRGRPVGVVGGGDSALQEALTLAAHAERVHLFHRGAAFSAQADFQRRVSAEPRITAHLATVVEEVLGETQVSGVRVRRTDSGTAEEIALAGLFVYIGLEPRTAFLRDLLPLDDDGRIPVDAALRTPLPGLFAAGDVRRDAAGQAVAAAGDGATAAVAAHRSLLGRPKVDSAIHGNG